MTRGGSRGQKKPSLNDLSRKSLDISELAEWQQELEEGSDRACALVAGSYLDHTLRTLISARLISTLSEKDRNSLFEDIGAPLGTMHSRILMAYALGDVTEVERNQLQCIRQVRNAFAHAPRAITFKHSIMIDHCKPLRLLSASQALTSGVSAVAAALVDQDMRRVFVLRCLNLTLGMLNTTMRHLGEKPALAVPPNDPVAGMWAALLLAEQHPSTEIPTPDDLPDAQSQG